MNKKTKVKDQNYVGFSRRDFIASVGSVAVPFTIIPRNVMPGTGYLQPSDTVNVARNRCWCQRAK